jgi:hypothetical protein
MQIKCDFCGAMIDETSERCPNCGAPLSGVNRTAKKQPKTIEELQEWYIAHHLPPEEVTRFFIGKNITEPRAFGIYKDGNGDFVVYKNKSTGERAVRYQGADEQYAVNELYQRLKAEIADQKGNRPTNRQQQPLVDKTAKKKKKRKGCLIAIIIFLALSILAAIFDNSAPNGYYNYKGTQYYHQGSSWYYYDKEKDDWFKSSEEIDITDKNAKDYQTDQHYGKDFEDTEWYSSGSHSDDNSDWDTDSDWDSGSDSWDSGSTDWDSDW